MYISYLKYLKAMHLIPTLFFLWISVLTISFSEYLSILISQPNAIAL